MPDPIRLLTAMAASAFAAGLTWLVLALPWPRSSASGIRLGWVWSVALGAGVGCWILGFSPSWPPREDTDRLLLLVMPATILAESIAAVAASPRWLSWGFRLAVIALTGPVLLHGSSYLADLAGPGTREWTGLQATLVLSVLAALLVAVWFGLIALQKRRQSRTIPLAIGLTLLAAGLAVMLTGYLTGGQIGLALSAALAGGAIASCAFVLRDDNGSSVGVGVVGLFSLLVVGRFFSALSSQQALILFLAPLLCWLTDLSPIRNLRPWASGIVRLMIVCVPLILVLVQAQRESAKGPEEPAGANEPTLQDYMNFGR